MFTHTFCIAPISRLERNKWVSLLNQATSFKNHRFHSKKTHRIVATSFASANKMFELHMIECKQQQKSTKKYRDNKWKLNFTSIISLLICLFQNFIIEKRFGWKESEPILKEILEITFFRSLCLLSMWTFHRQRILSGYFVHWHSFSLLCIKYRAHTNTHTPTEHITHCHTRKERDAMWSDTIR